MSGEPTDSTPIDAKVYLINTGKTPARDLVGQVRVWLAKDHQARPDFRPLGEDHPRNTLVPGPRLQYLAVISQWQAPWFGRLTGNKKYRDLGEIRFKALNVQYRPLGCHGPKQWQFTLLIGCSKKQRVYTPANALDTAAGRRKDLLQNPTWVEIHNG